MNESLSLAKNPETKVMSPYYVDNFYMKDIASVLNESRASRLPSKARLLRQDKLQKGTGQV